MTVTWIDSPGTELSARDAPVSFTVVPSGGAALITVPKVPFVSVKFPAFGHEEIAFRDGAFCAPYLDSTVADGMYTLRRTGGWPGAVTVNVDEAEPLPPAPLPTGGQSYGAIYELDFTTLPSQNLTPSAAYTIDGKTWYAKNAPSGASIQLVNGSGLNFWSYSASAPNSRHMCLPLASVPGFNATAPLQVWVHMVSLDSGHTSPAFGLIDTTSDLANYTASTLTGTYMIGYSAGAPTGGYYTVFRPDLNAGFSGPVRTGFGANTALGIAALNKLVDYGSIVLDYAGGKLPAADPWNYPTLYQTYTRAAARSNPMIAIGGSWNGNYNIKKISVLQPRLAA